MSSISSDPPEKPSECPTEIWQELQQCILSSDEQPASQFDIQNMEILLVQDNTNIEFHEETDLNEALQTTEIQQNIGVESSKKNEQDLEGILQIPENGAKKNTRKRKADQSKWKQNIRKQKRQQGEEYFDVKGKLHEKKTVRDSTCHSTKCYFDCSKKITHDERRLIHEQFWNLTDELKSHFYSKYVKCVPARRKRTTSEMSRKSLTYEYHFEINAVRLRVCQEFFLNTLNISKQRIYYFFKKVQDSNTNIPRRILQGKHTKKKISDDRRNEVRRHIESFAPVESHYCRALTKKKYLERDLNLTKMYNLYLTMTEDPVSFKIYSEIFNYEYNISFFKPKKDLCDRCEEYRNIRNPTEEQKTQQMDHMKRKKIGDAQRELDRSRYKSTNNADQTTCVVTFDMQNTFALPKAYIGHYYYKQKLSCFNLTGHCTLNNIVYNAIWHEYICGRAGTHIANAIVKILKAVMRDNPNLKKIILWSDSCVPQNRNSIFSFAIQHFLNSRDSGNLELIEHKYSEPGHGNLQEIDSAHSCIERFIKHLEIWSPLTLVKILINMPTTWKKKFNIMQMQVSDYLDYQKSSSLLNYQVVPYSKVKRIVYDKNNILNIKFCETFEGNLKEVKILPKKKTRRERFTSGNNILTADRLTDVNVGLTEEKKRALTEMLPQMPEREREFYHAILSKPAKKKETKKQNLSQK